MYDQIYAKGLLFKLYLLAVFRFVHVSFPTPGFGLSVTHLVPSGPDILYKTKPLHSTVSEDYGPFLDNC